MIRGIKIKVYFFFVSEEGGIERRGEGREMKRLNVGFILLYVL